nr:immunoglobulin light chain junction region [Macaca mulatta]MOV72010.1 immunoglobulin light chain junction region [Macaca mulatta]
EYYCWLYSSDGHGLF